MSARRAAALAGLVSLLAALPAAAEQQLPVYPGAVHTRIGNDLVIDGTYYRMAYFTTDDSMKKVGSYFLTHFKEGGYPTVQDGDFVTEGVVSALYTREGLQRAVVLRRHMGKTVGFTVLRDLWLTPGVAVAPKGAVKLEGTVVVSDIGSRDESGRGRARSAVVERPWKEVYVTVRDQLADRGFTSVRESHTKVDGKDALVLEHTLGKEQVLTVLSVVSPELTAVLQTFSSSDRPDGMPNDVAVEAAKRQHEAAQKGQQGRSKP